VTTLTTLAILTTLTTHARYAAQLEELSEELFSESASLYDEFGGPLHPDQPYP
jgi:hypothetical protein